jgi:chemotaxis protein methyltransferase CheR
LWQVSDAFRLVTLGDAFVYRRDDAADRGEKERRTILPDRRSGNRFERFGVERRSGRDRRAQVPQLGSTIVPTRVPLPPSPPPVTTKQPEPVPIAEVRRALAAGAYADAAALAERMAQAEPLAADAHYLRGLALSNLGRDADALVDLRKAVYLDPDLGFAHFLLAGALARIGEGVAAARSYRAAAVALARMPADLVAAELGGRSAAELVELCHQFAARYEQVPGTDGSER